MTKKHAYALIISPLVLAIFCVLVYVTLPYTAPFVLNKTLAKYEINVKKFEFAIPTLDNWNNKNFFIQHLIIEKQGLGSFDVRGANVTWQPQGQPRYEIKIHSLQFETTNNRSEPTLTDLSQFLPSTWLPSLPSVKLSIKQFHSRDTQLEFANLGLSVQHDRLKANATLFADVLAAFSKDKQVTIDLNIEATDEVQLELDSASNAFALTSKLHHLQADENNLMLHFSSQLQSKNWNFSAKKMLDKITYPGKAEINGIFTTPKQQVLDIAQLRPIIIEAEVTGKSKIANMFDVQNIELASQLYVTTNIDQGKWQTTITPQQTPGVEISSHFTHHKNKYHLNIDIEKPFIASGTFVSPIINIQAGSSLTAKITENEKPPLHLHLTAPQFAIGESSFNEEMGFDIELQGNIGPLIPALQLQDVSLREPQISFSGKITMNPKAPDKINVSIEKPSNIASTQVNLGETTLDHASLELEPQSFNIHLDEDQHLQQISSVKLTIHSKSIETPRLRIDDPFLKTQLSLKQQQMHVTVESNAVDLSLAQQNFYIPPLLLQSTLTLIEQTPTSAQFELLNICNDNLAKGTWQQKNQQVTVTWNREFTSTTTFRQWLNTSLLPIDFNKGRLSGTLKLAVGPQVALDKFDMQLHKAAGLGSFGVFSGVQFQLSSVQLPLEQVKNKVGNNTHLQLILNAAKLDTGFEVKDIRLQSDIYEKQQVWHAYITEAQAQLFGGSASLAKQTLVLDDEIRFKVLLEDLNLTKLVETQQMDKLRVTGTMSGQIPLALKQGKLAIEDGLLKGVTPGKIQFSNPLDSGGSMANQQLKLTMDVLKNFEYNKLQSDIVFEEGKLLISSALAGKNPDVQQGRPIHFNLNTEIELGGAIEAMRLQSGLESRIEKFVTSKLNPTTKKYYCEPS